MKLKKLKDLCWLLGIISIIIILAFLVSVTIVSATPTEIRDSVCTSINLTGTNCTTWWDGFNFTDDNFTYINTTEIIVEYNTHNHHYDYSNDTIYENKTYVSYNQTGNQSYLDNRYIQKGELEAYTKSSELNQIVNNTTIIKTEEVSNFTWWNVLLLVMIVFIMAIGFTLYKIIKEIEYLEEE